MTSEPLKCYHRCCRINHASFSLSSHQLLLVSTDTSSHLLELENIEHGPSLLSQSNEISDLSRDVPTIASANVLSRFESAPRKSEYRNGSQLIQVTEESVLLLNSDTGTCEDRWTPQNGRRIVLGDISPSQICVALSGGEIILLTLLGDKIVEQK